MADSFDPYQRWLSIPPKHQPPHHYRLLGLEVFEDDRDTIAAAADRQMAYVRTFQTGPYGEQSQKILNELAAAKICLLNQVRKQEYDQRLREELGTGIPSDSSIFGAEEEPAFVPDIVTNSGSTVGARTTATIPPRPQSGTRLAAPPRKRAPNKTLITIVMVAGGGISGLLLATLIMYLAGIGPFRPEIARSSPNNSVVDGSTPGRPHQSHTSVNSTGHQPTDNKEQDKEEKTPFEIPDITQQDQTNPTETLLAEAKMAIAEKDIGKSRNLIKQYQAAPDARDRAEAGRLLWEIETILSDARVANVILEELRKLPSNDASDVAAGRKSLQLTNVPFQDPRLREMFLERVPFCATLAFKKYQQEHAAEQNPFQTTDPREQNPFQEVNPFQELESGGTAPPSEENPFK